MALSFDRVAPIYAVLERLAFGSVLRQARESCCEELPPFRSALLIGDGDGRFLRELARRYPEACITYVDSSPKMLERARHGAPAEVQFHAEDILSEFTPDQHYDLVVTHFVLDVFTELQIGELVRKVQPCAAGGLWIVSEFSVSGTGLAHLGKALAVRIMYLFFALTAGLQVAKIPDYRSEFSCAGFTLLRKRSWWRDFIVSEVWRIPKQ